MESSDCAKWGYDVYRDPMDRSIGMGYSESILPPTFFSNEAEIRPVKALIKEKNYTQKHVAVENNILIV